MSSDPKENGGVWGVRGDIEVLWIPVVGGGFQVTSAGITYVDGSRLFDGLTVYDFVGDGFDRVT